MSFLLFVGFWFGGLGISLALGFLFFYLLLFCLIWVIFLVGELQGSVLGRLQYITCNFTALSTEVLPVAQHHCPLLQGEYLHVLLLAELLEVQSRSDCCRFWGDAISLDTAVKAWNLFCTEVNLPAFC